MHTTRLSIEYDGSGFRGWAAQPGLRTVQGELEAALETILRERVALRVAGRTDAGVHATGQVASFESEAESPDSLAHRLNGVLTADLAVTAAEPRAGRLRRSRRRPLTDLLLPAADPLGTKPPRAGAFLVVAATARSRGTRRLCGGAGRQARLHRVHPDRHRPRPLRARGDAGGVGARKTAEFSASGSRPTPLCAEWSAPWSGPCSRSEAAVAAPRISPPCSRAPRASEREIRPPPTVSISPRSAT